MAVGPVSSLATALGVGGASALSNLFGGNKTSSTVTPSLSPLQQSIQNQILATAGSNLNQDPDLRGYTANAIGQNNQQATQYGNVLNNLAAQRGLTGSPTALAAQSNLAAQNYKSNTDVLDQVPLMRQQLLQQKLASTSAAFRATPFGLKQTGNSGSPLSQALSGFTGAGGFKAAGELAGGGW